MMSKDDYRALMRQAGVEGLFVGLLWIASFLFFIAQFQTPFLIFVSMLLACASAVMVVVRLRNYRDRHLYGLLPFSKAFSYSLSIYIYASLIMAIGQWLYFEYIDQGRMVAGYMLHIKTPEFKAMMSAIDGFDEKTFKEALNQIAELRPIDIALQFFSTNVVVGFLLAIPTALICKRNNNNPGYKTILEG